MTNSEEYKSIIQVIIKAQEQVIGPLALDIANKVPLLTSPNKEVLGELVKKYKDIFGQASVETCKDAVKPLLAKYKDIDLPEILS